MSDQLINQRGLFSEGYGLIPKKIMKMTDLSIEAKAIFAFFMSYSGAGATSFPSVDTIITFLGISENRFYKYRNELIEKNLLVVKERYKEGKRTSNLYEINFNEQPLQIKGIEQPLQIKGIGFEGIGFEGTIINSSFINNNKDLINNKKTNIMYETIFQEYQNANLVKHTKFTPDMKKAIDLAKKQLGLCEQDFINIIKRHKQKYELTKGSQYPIRKRTLSELFGQKKSGGVSLICSDYLDDVWEPIKSESNHKNEVIKDGVKFEGGLRVYE
jgi:hypothetical protein